MGAATAMWFAPRQTIRRLHDAQINRALWVLVPIHGIFRLLTMAEANGLGYFFLTSEIIIGCVLLGPLAGFISMAIFSRLFQWVASWFGGDAPYSEVKRAYVWCCLPYALMLLLLGQQLLTRGALAFIPLPQTVGETPDPITLLNGFLQLILLGWGIVLGAGIIGETEGFSSWRGLAVLLISLMIAIVIIVAIAMLLATIGS